MSKDFKTEKAIYVEFSDIVKRMSKMKLSDTKVPSENNDRDLGILLYEDFLDWLMDIDDEWKINLISLKDLKMEIESYFNWLEKEYKTYGTYEVARLKLGEAKRQTKILLNKIPLSFYVRLKPLPKYILEKA